MPNIPTNREELLGLTGEFLWDFGQYFLIQTERGNFVWSDPDYSGDDTIRPFNGDYDAFLTTANVPFCRSKGTHVIANYVTEKTEYRSHDPWGRCEL